MASEDRIEALRMKHQAIDNEIQVENLRPLPDDAHISKLKKEKLKLKDEISRLAHV